MDLGSSIRQERVKKDWTQAIAARKIGIQQSYLSKIENGQFVPSHEILEKVIKAYDLPKNTFSAIVPSKKLIRPLKIICVLGLIIGLTLFFCGYFELFYQQNYYTYQTTNLTPDKGPSLSFHLTDKYHGENYESVFAKHVYSYKLIGVRNIPRPENNWLKAIGCLVLLVTIGVIIRRWLEIKHNKSP